MHRSSLSILSLMVSVIGGCSEEPGADSGVMDGGADARRFDAGMLVTPPQIPWLEEGSPPVALPRWDSCPDGWRSVESDDGSFCEPYPETGAEECGAGEVHFLGGAGCEPVGAPCPSSEFPAGVPASAVFVRAGAGGGGDGSRAAPFATLAAVPWSSLPRGATIALAKGTYDGTLPLRPGDSVIGACAGETIVTGQTGSSAGAVVSIVGTGSTPARVVDLTISDAPGPGIWVGRGQAISVEGVVIERLPDFGVLAQEECTASLSRVVVRDARTPNAGAFPRAIMASFGAQITVANVVVERAIGIAFQAQNPGSVITARDVVVRDMRFAPGGMFGSAALAASESELTIERALFEGAQRVQVISQQPGSRVTLDQVIVRGRRRATGESDTANGIVAERGGHIEAHALVIEGNLGYAAAAEGPGSSLAITDAILLGGQSLPSDPGSRGLGAQMGGNVSAARVTVSGVEAIAVYLNDPGSVGTIEDLLVHAPATTRDGHGIQFSTGASLTLARARIEGVRGFGIVAGYESPTATIEDVVIRDVAPLLLNDSLGEAISAQFGTTLVGTRVLVEGSRRTGINVFHDGTNVTFEDLVIRDTLPHIPDLLNGRGIHVSSGATANVTRALIEESHKFGVAAIVGSTLTMTDVRIAGVRSDGCIDGGCASDGQSTAGVFSASGSATSLARFVIEDVDLCGFMVDEGADMLLSEGVITRTEIGACIQDSEYDLSRAMDMVQFIENGTNLDTTSLPVPEPIEAVAPMD